MMKKLVALLMALAMLCSCIGAFAEDVDHSGCTNNHKSTSEDKPDVAATCTEDGYEWWWCDQHQYYKVKTEDKLNHDFSVLTGYTEGKAPTYTEGGEGIFKCSRCDATETREVDKLTTKYGPLDGFDRYMETPNDGTHKHGWVNDEASEAPVCVYDGYYYVLCADCGQYYKYVREGAQDHDWRDEKHTLVKIEPKRTCTVDGVEHWTNYCKVCEKDIEWTTTLPAYGHSYRDKDGNLTVEGEVIREADCTNNEIRRFTCTRVVDGVVCGSYEDIEIKDTAKGHSWEEEGTEHTHVIKQVTCAEDGSYGQAKICDRCGKPDPDSITTVEEIKALDHTKEWKKNIRGLDEDGELIRGYYPDAEKLLKDLYKELKALGVELKPFEETNIQEVIKAIEDQEIPADVLIKVLDKVTVDMYPVLYYELPGADDETGEGYLDLSKVDAIPAYDVDVEIEIGDGSEGSENPLQKVTVTGHIHETKVVYNAPTCTATGSIVLTCTECNDEYVIELPKLEHAYITIRGIRGINDLEYSLIKDCTKANSFLKKCIFCGHCYNQAIEPAKKHTIELPEYDEEDGALYGDCMIVGFVQQKEWDDAPVTYYLNGDSLDDMDVTMAQFNGEYWLYKNRLASAFGHIATCRDFDVIVKCAVGFCEHTEKIHVAAYMDHEANGYIIDKDPTCTEEGVHTFNCKKCGEFHTDYDPANNHKPVNGKTLVEPKCTEKGSREIICSVCKEVLGTEEIPALTHHWIAKDIPANCAEGKMGLRYEYCSRCGEVQNEEPYAGHKIGTEHGRKPATCELPGTIYGVCEICHNDVEEVIPKLGHTYEDENYVHGVNGACWTEENPTPKGHYCEEATCKPGAEHGNICWHVCTRCGDEKKVDDGAVVEHNMYKIDEEGQRVLNRFAVKELPACDKTGKAEYVCSRCEYHEKNYELPALPHNYQIEFDQATGAYNLVCTKMDNTELGLTNLYNKMIETSYKDNEQVADAIVDMLSKSTGEKIKGTGCGDVKPFEIRKTEYVVTQISDKKGQVELVEGALAAKDDLYVRIAWRYSNEYNEVVCVVMTYDVKWSEFDKFGNPVLGTFKITGPSLDDSYHCDYVNVDVVSDPDADYLWRGQYTCYGTETFNNPFGA